VASCKDLCRHEAMLTPRAGTLTKLERHRVVLVQTVMSDGGYGGAHGGIRVKRETFIIMSDRNENEPLVRDASPTVSIRSGETDPQVQQYCRPKRFRKLSNSSSLLSEIFRHPDTSEDVLRTDEQEEEGQGEEALVLDFLEEEGGEKQGR
jgi:hypothetical protein